MPLLRMAWRSRSFKRAHSAWSIPLGAGSMLAWPAGPFHFPVPWLEELAWAVFPDSLGAASCGAG